MQIKANITTLPYLLNKIKYKLWCYLSDIYFLIIRKPFYTLFYNTNGNKFICDGKMRKSKLMLTGGGNVVEIEKGVLLNNVQIEINGKNNKLILRKGVKFAEGGRIRIEDKNNTVELDENAKMINCFLSSADNDTRLYIGKDSLFSADVIVRTSDAHSIIVEGTNERINSGKDVIIGNHVWICNGARIMKGTTIGDNCIIGSNSLVAGQQINDNCLAVGNPCKVVKTNVNWTNIRL